MASRCQTTRAWRCVEVDRVQSACVRLREGVARERSLPSRAQLCFRRGATNAHAICTRDCPNMHSKNTTGFCSASASLDRGWIGGG
eukprot:2440598-Pyramimonas_sp.AAC.2